MTVRTVVHVIDSLGRSGGAEHQLVANLRRFSDPSLTHRVLCLYGPTEGSRANEVPDAVPIDYVAQQRIRNRWKLIREMRRVLSDLRPDLVHCALPDAGLATRIAARRTRILVVESLVNLSHQAVHTVDNPAVTPWKLAVHRAVDRITMRRVTAFHAISDEVARSWSETVGIPSSRVTVIPRGVDLTEFPIDDERGTIRNEVRNELGLAVDAFIIANIGRQVPQKGQLYAVRAMPAILAEVPRAYLASLGSRGPVSDRLRQEASRLGVSDRVIWGGIRSDVPRFLFASDLFLFPSLYEGLGVSLLQAMAASLPCVATDRAPMNEVVTSETGILVDAQDPAAIAKGVIALAHDPQRRDDMGYQGRLRVAADFSADTTAREIEELYLALLDGSR